MKIPHTALILVSLTFAFACSTAPSKNIPNNYSTNSANGLIVGSVSIMDEKPRYNSYFVHYREIGSKKIGSIRISPEQIIKMRFVPDFFEGSKAVYLFSFEKPEGNYEFFRLDFFTNSGYAPLQRLDKSSEFSLPFQARSGKITYVGEIVIDSKSSKQYKEVNNKYDRDIAALSEKISGIEWRSAENETIVPAF